MPLGPPIPWFNWRGPVAPGTAGQVLTSNGGTAAPTFQPGGGGGGGVGTVLAYTSAAGSVNDVAPGSFGSMIGRLEVTLSNITTWTGLTAGADAQLLIVSVVAGAFLLTLSALDSGSMAANQFRASASLTLGLNDSILLCYYAGSVNKWVVIP
jgi:hypothetical protein